MQTRIHPDLLARPEIVEADAILRSCVHCGFCTAVCPTYQLLGDELDGPRGRIYLIKDLLERDDIDRDVTVHIDRCLTCRACETACPSGVRYGRLLDIGRNMITEKVTARLRTRVLGAALRSVVPSPSRLMPLLRLGQIARPLLPRALRRHVPERRAVADYPSASEAPEKRVIVLRGCVQRAATPNVNRALEYLLSTQRVGVDCVEEEGCCGALDYHLGLAGAHEAGMARMRALIDALYPRLGTVDAIVSTASGCGVTVKEYGEIFSTDDEYRDKAKAIAAQCVDASEYLARFDFRVPRRRRIAFQSPCTLQHGQQLAGAVEKILDAAGFELLPVAEAQLCCGSAGTYSILQPALSRRLLSNKLVALTANDPEVIATANVGCQLHLQAATAIPVMHWVELLANEISLGVQPPQ